MEKEKTAITISKDAAIPKEGYSIEGKEGAVAIKASNEMIIDDRTRDYARLMASVGINGIVINNVNVKGAATYLITDRFLTR